MYQYMYQFSSESDTLTGADHDIEVTIGEETRNFHVFEDGGSDREHAVTVCTEDSWLAIVESDTALAELLDGLNDVGATKLWIGLHKVSEWRLANGIYIMTSLDCNECMVNEM